MRWIVGGKAAQRCAASPSQMGRFETQWLAPSMNLSALAELSGQWIDLGNAALSVPATSTAPTAGRASCNPSWSAIRARSRASISAQTRPSPCPRQLPAYAGTPEPIKDRSLTSQKEKLTKLRSARRSSPRALCRVSGGRGRDSEKGVRRHPAADRGTVAAVRQIYSVRRSIVCARCKP
jgi:hypothetical protein